ncbi:MAG: M14 family metallopeptidase [Steroidobacteraceae bacterium]
MTAHDTRDVPLTLAEQSAFRSTGRTEEVERLAREYARRWPDAVSSFEYGRSAEGRPLRALLVTRTGALTAAELKQRSIPLLMIQAGIHPGESDGKDAGFMVLRDMLSGQCLPGALDEIAILFVPAFNTDGHERVGRWNRPNQVGPEETGWRTTAQNLNLNRDYMKADAPEMQSMLALLNEWDPLVSADMHVTDGADFEPDISIQVEPINQGNPDLYASGTRLRDELMEKLERTGSVPLPFYPDLYRTDDPESGFLLTVYSPRFSTGYFPARNRFTVLVETHSWKDYAHRVRTTCNTIIGLVELMRQYGAGWLEEVRRADVADAGLAGKDVALGYGAGWREPTSTDKSQSADFGEPHVTMIDFRGYAYTRILSSITGDLVTVYDPRTPENWYVPFRKNTAPSLVAKAPGAGYVVPAGFAEELSRKFLLHGIDFEVLTAPLQQAQVAVFRATRAEFSSAPFEGRMLLTVDGSWLIENRGIPAGSLFVPIAQPRARLLMALLEPQAPDSLAAWGFFNGCFEVKEHMEPYVGEMIAKQMLEDDQALAEQFALKLRDDLEFASSPAARLEFFHRRHASWDERLNLYPVYRMERSLR